MTFKRFDLSPELLRAVEELGYSEPTPIQQQAIPLILEGGDLLATAQTGTGKTAGFTLPLLQNLIKKNKPRGVVRCLILTPTRELASQVRENVKSLSKYLLFQSVEIFGGVSMSVQVKRLRKGADLLIATPGRLLDLVQQRVVDLSQVEILVLDEADRMLDMGFIHDIRKILGMLSKKRQNLLFSATCSNTVKQLADQLLQAPKIIQMAPAHSTAERVTQTVHPVDKKLKQSLLSFLITSKQWSRVLVFVRTKHGANRLAEQLLDDGISATAIHGNKSQGARTKALSEFKKGAVQVLVATDVAARGLDIDHLPHVVNFDLPSAPEDYVHRIGRTGRAGRSGEAISLVCVDEHSLLHQIERNLKLKIQKEIIPNYEPDPSIRAEPIRNGRQHHRSKPQQGRRFYGKHR